MSKKLIGLIVVTLVAAASIVMVLRGTRNDSEIVRIGTILPLTESASILGKGVREGIDIAVEEVNAAGGIDGKRVVLQAEDSKNDPKEGVSAFQKLMAINRPVAIITEMSSVSKALAPLADRNEMVLFATVTASPNLTKMSKWVFRNYYSTQTQGEALAQFLVKEKKPNKVGILYLTDDYGTAGLEELKRALNAQGINDIVMEGYAKDATDILAPVTKIKAANVDVLCVIAYDEALARAFREARELGFKGTLCTYTGLADPKVLGQAGASAEGAYVAMADYDPSSPKAGVQANFVKRYQEIHGSLPSHYPAFGYDTVMTIIRGLKAEKKGSGLREALVSMVPFQGVMGSIAINSNREVEFPQTVRIVRNGSIKPID
jgi:branched-chain amino acid transport system substrate-binding protein